MTAAPDVTVVIAVYNTMPYLVECLESLTAQSIGRKKLEIVAVDDGSTDGSGEELDRWAARYPGTIKVVHQENSGGPAAPSNRALDLATGRYVFFIGSDDHLGKEALKRLVDCADTHTSDVVVGKMVGTNGRYVHQALYRSNDPDVSLYDSALPFTLANTKLFRRELIERHKLRFPEDLPVGSDQPFTIEACVRARKISVVADYTCYYAVKRGDAGNITYRADHLARLHCTERIMRHTAGLIEAGPRRDAVLKRHFTWELTKLVQGPDFAALDSAVQYRLCNGIAQLADEYLTEPLNESLGVQARVRIALARRGDVRLLKQANEAEAPGAAVPFVLEGERTYARYPGFRDALAGLDDELFRLNDEAVPKRIADGTRLAAAGWEQNGDDMAVSLAVRVPVTGTPESLAAVALRLVPKAFSKASDKTGARRMPEADTVPPTDALITREPDEDGTGTVLRVTFPLPATRVRTHPRVFLTLGGIRHEVAVAVGETPLPLARRWREKVPYRVSANATPNGRLMITTAPLWGPEVSVSGRVRQVMSRVKRKMSR
ncbi:glycosyltransferase family 2 protein [Streptomyces sp. NPDC094448]|uniref:glycosyltransferase family 2 protein n=1 Tax=Streptomyces sp. NPDC094448 TaxID=3366063 RepID=UPI0037F2BBAD